MTGKLSTMVALVGLVMMVGGCSGDEPSPPCARIAALQPGEWAAVDLSGCDEPADRVAVWAGGQSGIDPLGAEVVVGDAGCAIVWGGPSIAALSEGPWCLTVVRDGLPEDAVCVPEDVPGADPGTGLLLVRQGDDWIAALPGPSASCAPELGGEGG